MKTIWKGPGFQLVSVPLKKIFSAEDADYHAVVSRAEVRAVLLSLGLDMVEEKHVLVFGAITKRDTLMWPADGAAMRFFMDPLSVDKTGEVDMTGPGKHAPTGYELGLYRNLVRDEEKDPFPHLFYAPVPLTYPRLSTLIARS